MKIYMTLSLLLLISINIFAGNKKNLYIIDFYNFKKYDSILGKTVADEFESFLELCESKYQIVPRKKYQKELKDKTFEYTKRFLEKEGIDYVIYGDIFHDDDLRRFTIEYIFEDVHTGAIILIETINFFNKSELVNDRNRQKVIRKYLTEDKELCKRLLRKQHLYVIDFHNHQDFNSVIGKNIAQEFENSLHLCKCLYKTIPKKKYINKLTNKTFYETKSFLANQDVDYVIYGSVYIDSSNQYIIEYFLESLDTKMIILIDHVKFEHLSDLLNHSERQNVIDKKLKKEKELCRRLTNMRLPLKASSMEIDTDKDGVPDAIDQEPNTPIEAEVNDRGIAVNNRSKEEKEFQENTLPAFQGLPELPTIYFPNHTVKIDIKAQEQLNEMGKRMIQYPVLSIIIEGEDRKSPKIAQKRADAVKAYLIQHFQLPEVRFTIRTNVEPTAKSVAIINYDLVKMKL